MSSPGSDLSSTIISTFIASIKSVGTACTLAGVGIYLHQRGFVIGNGKRTLALISQQVTIPLLFFTKILYCNQNSSTEPCPNVTSSLRDAWILLIWPLWVCSIGLCVGYVVVFLGNITCKQKRNAIMVSIAFGNCTGLPITLLTVIHSNFDNHSKLGIVDPTLFLSVYLVIYPVLQWGIGGMMLSPSTPPQSTTTTTTTAVDEIDKEKKVEDETLLIDNDSDDEEKDENDDSEGACSIAFKQNSANSTTSSTRESLREVLTSTTRALVQNVINQKNTRAMSMSYKIHNRGLASVDASMYMSVPENLNEWGMPIKTTFHNQNGNSNKVVDIFDGDGKQHHYHHQRIISEIDEEIAGGTNNNNMDRTEGTTETETSTSSSFLIEPPKEHDALLPKTSSRSPVEEEELEEDKDKVNLCTTILSIIIRCLQPPVIGALLGLFCTSIPDIRSIFVDIIYRQGNAPLQWFFDGLYEVGLAAVPINMIILGCNLSASYMIQSPESKLEIGESGENEESSFLFSNSVSVLVVIGKMICMPIIGFISTYLLSLIYTIPEEIAGGIYLVLLIVFLCPTANNVMVMIELASSGGNGSGPSLKEGMARIIAYQYAVSPLLLSGTVTGAVLMATYLGGNNGDGNGEE